MSGIAPRGRKRAGSPLSSGRDSPAPGVRMRDEEHDALIPGPHVVLPDPPDRLYSHVSAISADQNVTGIVNNSSNTTNIAGDGIVNNSINNFVFTSSNSTITPNLAEQQKAAIKAITLVLGDRFVRDAMHDTQPKDAGCMSGTRVTILTELMSWTANGLMKIFWIAGMAGTGKTSIAVTLCSKLQNDPTVIFGGSFFCSRTTGSVSRTDVRRILPTLVASLAAQVPDFAVALAAELEKDDGAVYKPASDQIIALLKKPLAAISPASRNITFLIDALDECSDTRELAELLTAIADFKCETTVKFILTSRPEMHIRGTPISNPEHNTILQLHTISEEEVAADIRRYITGTLARVPSNIDWYTNNDIDALVRLSHGLFIFASTVLNYILAREHIKGRKDRLQKATSTANSGPAATSSLDKIYEMIVHDASRPDQVEEDELLLTRRVIACILAGRASFSVEALADLLDLEVGDLRGSLERLHSVIYVPVDDVAAGVRVLHASFGDYIVSRAADDVRVDASLGDEALSRGCLHVMSQRLCFNISQSRTSYEPNPTTRPESITLSLEYACLEWIYHVSRISDPSTLNDDISKVFCPRLLFWLEVASVLGRVGRATAMLHFATSTVRLTELSQFLRDARIFVTSSREAIEKSAPHIYLSALPVADKNSLVYKTFAPLCTGIISVETFGIDSQDGRLVMTLAGHKQAVNSVAYSADFRLLASGSEDGTVRIWDVRIGEEIMPPLRSGGGNVSSVAFAPSGKMLASGHVEHDLNRLSFAGSVCIWRIGSSQMTPKRLTGHSFGVFSVAFSSDDSLLASASADRTVRLWKPDTGQNVAVLHGHEDKVEAVTFSPNARILASCSQDSIRTWDAATGELVSEHKSEDRSEYFSCLAFSPDGTKLASASDKRIKLWEPRTLNSISREHDYRSSSSVQFSPDGSLLVTASRASSAVHLLTAQLDHIEVLWSGSDSRAYTRPGPAVFSPDGMYVARAANDLVQIIDVGGTQATVQPVKAPYTHSWSVAALSDGSIIAAGAEDETLRVWDAWTDEPKLPPLVHASVVCSVAISPDGRLVASGLEDGTVQVWNARTGMRVGEPLCDHTRKVRVVKFSPDGRWLVSGSYDDTTCIWDVTTERPFSASSLRCKGDVPSIAFSPDRQIIAVGTGDGYLHLWSTKTREFVRAHIMVTGSVWNLSSFFAEIHSIAYSPDGALIAIASEGRIGLWDVSTSRLSLEFRLPSTNAKLISFSSDGRYVVSGIANNGLMPPFSNGEIGIICFWDVSTGAKVASLCVPTSSVRSIVLTPDAHSIVSCSSDGVVFVLNVAKALSWPSTDSCDPFTALQYTKIRKGWLVGPRKELLLWVPSEYRAHLHVPPFRIRMGRRRVVLSGHERELYHGENWTACWHGGAPNA